MDLVNRSSSHIRYLKYPLSGGSVVVQPGKLSLAFCHSLWFCHRFTMFDWRTLPVLGDDGGMDAS